MSTYCLYFQSFLIASLMPDTIVNIPAPAPNRVFQSFLIASLAEKTEKSGKEKEIDNFQSFLIASGYRKERDQ